MQEKLEKGWASEIDWIELIKKNIKSLSCFTLKNIFLFYLRNISIFHGIDFKWCKYWMDT